MNVDCFVGVSLSGDNRMFVTFY